MRFTAGTFTIALLMVLGATFPAMSAEPGDNGRVRGVVADGSGGVLPGVTVVATADDGRVVGTGVTDAQGRYVLAAIPAVRVRLTFQLEGFSTAVADVTVAPAADTVVPQRLTVAPRAETVDVVADAPPGDAPMPRRLSPVPPRPAPVLVPVVEHDRDSICGPAKRRAVPETLGTIRSRRDSSENGLYGTSDELVIDGGTLSGLEVGRNVVARRTFSVTGESSAPIGEHTAGLLQIVAASEQSSVAVVVYACDELMRGDRLEAFAPEPVRTPEPAGMPAFDRAAQILFADVGQMLGAPRRLMVIDQGSDKGMRPGQRLTLFRRQRLRAGVPSIVGDAVVVAVQDDSATIRVERAVDVIASGDWAAPQQYSPVAPSVTPGAEPRRR